MRSGPDHSTLTWFMLANTTYCSGPGQDSDCGEALRLLGPELTENCLGGNQGADGSFTTHQVNPPNPCSASWPQLQLAGFRFDLLTSSLQPTAANYLWRISAPPQAASRTQTMPSAAASRSHTHAAAARSRQTFEELLATGVGPPECSIDCAAKVCDAAHACERVTTPLRAIAPPSATGWSQPLQAHPSSSTRRRLGRQAVP